MVTFTDRVPTYPGRVRLTPVTGQPDVYDLTREDDPVVAGTALNAAFFTALQSDMTETGSYNGPGSNTVSITFAAVPKMFFVIANTASSSAAMAMWISGAPALSTKAYNAENTNCALTWTNDNKTVSWTGSNNASTLSKSTATYYWLAIY